MNPNRVRRVRVLLGSCLLFGCEALLVSARPTAAATVANLPFDFVENRGQWHGDARFVLARGGLMASFTRDAVRLRLGTDPASEVILTFEGTSPHTTLAGDHRRGGAYNFFVGGDPTQWHARVPAYGAVHYRGLYDGIDMRVREEAGRLEYDLMLEPGADLGRVVVRAQGTSAMELAPDGTLILSTARGPLRQTPPKTWEVLPTGARRPVDCRFRLIDGERYGFEAPGRDPALALVVDPGLVWSTFLGGSSGDWIQGLARAGDGSGDLLLFGASSSTDFPPVPVPAGGQPIFILRLNAAGDALVYATVLAASTGTSWMNDVESDAAGSAWFAGSTQDATFPTTPGAYRRTSAGGDDAVVGRLDPSGVLEFSTLLGGADLDLARGVALDPTGSVVVTGVTQSLDFPTTAGAFDTSFNAPPAGDNTAVAQDTFLARFTPDGSQLTYGSYFGGQTYEDPVELLVDPQGFVTVIGNTTSSATGRDMPVTADAFDRTWNGSEDAFVARFHLDGAGAADLRYATFLGGINIDTAYGASLQPTDPQVVTVAGLSWVDFFTAPFFPTTSGALKPALTPVFPPTQLFPHVRTGFVTRFRFPASGPGTLAWSTYVGGGVSDYATDVIVDDTGAAIVVGGTESFELPTTRGAFDRTYAGDDCFVWKLSADGARLLYGTYLGGSRSDIETHEPAHVVTAGGSRVVIAGITNSADFPSTPGAFDSAYAPGPPGFVPPQDGFVTEMELEADASGDVSVGTPVLLSPANGAIFPTTGALPLRWSAVADPSGIEAYNYEVSSRSDFPPAFVSHRGSVPTPSVTLSSLAVQTPYFWRVQAADRAGNLGAWSAPSSFTLGVAGAPPVLAFIVPTPPRVNGGRTSSAIAYLNFGAVAPSGGAVVTLRSSDPAVATVPASVTIPAGANSASFPIGTTAVARQTTVTISGELGLAFDATLTVEPPEVTLLSGFTISPGSVPAGTPASGTVSISNPAPAGGASVLLSSNNAAATVPGAVTIPAGNTSTSFTIPTSSVSAATQVGISAAHVTSLLALVTVTPVSAPAPLTRPTLLSPSNDAQVPQPITFDWSDVNGAASYTIHIDDTSAFSAPFVMTQTVTASRLTTGALPRRTLWWRVRANSASGAPGAWSLVRRVRPTTGPVATTTTTTTSPPTTTTSPPTTTTTAPVPSTTTTTPVTATSTTTAAPTTTTTAPTTTTSAPTTTIQVTTTTVPPTADTVAIQVAEYDGGNRRLRVEATSSNSSATLTVHVTSTNAVIGTLSNDGGGRYRGDLSWSVNPQSITVRSSRGGTATRSVTVK